MDQSLPDFLDERMRWVVPPESASGGPGDFVLYWMHNALRAHENPALDVAICLARQNGLRLLVYHGLSEDYPYASDRLHAFILQGHRDVQRELSARGISAVCHVQRDGARGPHLRTLVNDAAVVISEEMPVQPLVGWIERLAARTTTPIGLVDTSCLVPVSLLDRPFENTDDFRDAAQVYHAQRVEAPYPAPQDPAGLEYEDPVCFESFDLQDCCLANLISGCRIDHSVAPVRDTPGGTRAGYARWSRFKERGLGQYADQRDDPTNQEGVSRISAYLHFGMISPFRIAREAAALKASHFLDEFLVWRELAFHHCIHFGELIDTFEGLPGWARSTLLEHQDDDRRSVFSWEKLARGKTGIKLWDACQRSLIRHGELHQNVRRTWGKGVLALTATPQQALRYTLDLNHRYSLDGRDPCSYGGILWCFGQFDQPSSQEKPVFGTLRTRCIDEHEKAIDFGRFVDGVDRPLEGNIQRVAVVGAGLAGLVAARTLVDHRMNVTLFDKSRGVGGRLATRRVESTPNGSPDETLSFDHGAQYFTTRDSRFGRYVCSWLEEGIVQPWHGRIVEWGKCGNVLSENRVLSEKSGQPRYVGVPTMNSIAKHLAADLVIRTASRVTALVHDQDAGGWEVKTESSEAESAERFDAVICNMPPTQVADLVGTQAEWSEELSAVEMDPCIAWMVQSKAMSELPFDGAFINDGPIAWMARNDSKPGRAKGVGASWTIHASPQWSRKNIDEDDETLSAKLASAIADITGCQCESDIYQRIHRWRYSIPAKSLTKEFLWDPTMSLGACGDWLGGGRVEGAFLSGQAIAGRILRGISIDR